MNYGNLKIYSTPLYGWELSKKDYSTQSFVPYDLKNLSSSDQYNEPLYLIPKVILDQIFLVDEMGVQREVLTGTRMDLVTSSQNESAKELSHLSSIMPYFIKKADLHEEVDTKNITNYLKQKKIYSKIKNVLNDQINYCDMIIDFNTRQQEYKKENEKKVKELALLIKKRWK